MLFDGMASSHLGSSLLIICNRYDLAVSVMLTDNEICLHNFMSAFPHLKTYVVSVN
jgi:hypothetical protein